MSGDPRVDAYIERQADFARPVLIELRRRLHGSGLPLAETIKWGMPFFLLNDRPFANMAAFKAHASFGFWRGAGGKTGREEEGMGQFGRLRSVGDLPPEDGFRQLVRAAATRNADAPARPRPRAPVAIPTPLPNALVEALAADPVANAAFNAFSRAAQGEYGSWIAEAKRPGTQARRLAEALGWIREGKRRNWKYER